MISKKITFLLIVLFTLTAKSQVENYTIKNISINNSYSNFGTTFYGDDKVVYASPKKKSYIIRNVWKENNQPFLDLYMGDIAEDGELINIKKFSSKLNTRYHEADVAFTKDMKTVYFSRNNYFDKTLTRDSLGSGLIHLYRAKIDANGEWVDEQPMPFNSDNYQTGHPTLSADEKTLYFISDMPGGFGKTDIYKTSIASDGSVGKPINMGSKINTPAREMFSSISGNNELYFSSDGRTDGLGELDIYVTKISGDNVTEPINVGAPINSEKDDFAFILNYETRRGYFSSNRNGGQGDDDIYTFNQEIPIEFECKQMVKGIVSNKVTGELLPNTLVVLTDDKGVEINRTIVGDSATFNFKVDCNKSYKVEGSNGVYIPVFKDFYVVEGDDNLVSLELMLDEFVAGNGKCLIKINPIYFDFDKSNIRKDAKVELDKVVSIMQKYPEIVIEGGSHTDSRGLFRYNEKLSSRRAKSSVNYILSKGIDPNRISSKGYGEYQLVNKCIEGVKCSEKEHQFNRRTEFKIMNFDEVKKKYKHICKIQTASTKDHIEEGVEINVDPKLNYYNEFIKQGDDILMKINPVEFELNSSYINSTTKKALNKVVKIMAKHPNIIVECAAFTDARASTNYSMSLTEKRAKAAVDYIIASGISASRITGVGYGESKLLNNCSDGVECSEAQHKQNRRMEFLIKNPDMISY